MDFHSIETGYWRNSCALAHQIESRATGMKATWSFSSTRDCSTIHLLKAKLLCRRSIPALMIPQSHDLVDVLVRNLGESFIIQAMGRGSETSSILIHTSSLRSAIYECPLSQPPKAANCLQHLKSSLAQILDTCCLEFPKSPSNTHGLHKPDN